MFLYIRLDVEVGESVEVVCIQHLVNSTQNTIEQEFVCEGIRAIFPDLHLIKIIIDLIYVICSNKA